MSLKRTNGDAVKFRQCGKTLICKECGWIDSSYCNAIKEDVDDQGYIRGTIIESIFNPFEERVECRLQIKDRTIMVQEKYVQEDDEALIANKSW